MTFWPPGRLSTMTCWPHIFESRSATSRAVMSGEAPAGCDRIQCTGLFGQSWATVGPAAAIEATSKSARAMCFMAPPFCAGITSTQFDDLLRELVQLFRDALAADQEIV